jgi:hypothetical protein
MAHQQALSTLDPGPTTGARFWRRPYAFDTYVTVHSRSSSQCSPDGYIPPFPRTRTTPAIEPEQLPVVWTQTLQSESEGPTLIFCAARLLQVCSVHEHSFAPSWRTVIRKTHHDHIAARLLLSPSLDPQVEHSGRTQAQCWWATGSSCFRLLIGRSPVPRSVPQSVSCVLHYHPGQRDFPSPVGSGDISARSLPGRQAVQAMVRVRGLQFGLLHASPGWLMRIFRTLSSGAPFRSRPSPPRAPLLQRRYPLSSLLRAHRPIPMPPARTSCFALITSVPTACTIHGWSLGPSRLWFAFLCWSAVPLIPAACRVQLTSSSSTTSAFASLRTARLSASPPQNGFMWTTYFDTAGIP